MKNRSFKEAIVVMFIIISTPFSVVLVTKLFALFVGVLFGWHHYQVIVGQPGVWVLATFAGLFAHILLVTAYLEDRYNSN